MRPTLVPRETHNLFDEEFSALFKRAEPYLSHYQITTARKSAGEYTSRSKATEAHHSACGHIHEGLLNSISKIIRKKFPNDRHAEIEFMLGLLNRLEEL